MKCPRCDSEVKQYKIGKTAAGSQRYRCSDCNCSYTPLKKERGYHPEIRQKAVRLYVNGFRPRRIGYLLQVHHTTVSNWIQTYLQDLPHKSDRELKLYLE